MKETTKGSTPIALRLPDDQLKYLKKMSHYISLERGEDLNYVDLIREAIDSAYPMPKEDGPDGKSEKQANDWR